MRDLRLDRGGWLPSDAYRYCILRARRHVNECKAERHNPHERQRDAGQNNPNIASLIRATKA
jgi:hypothetical protein